MESTSRVVDCQQSLELVGIAGIRGQGCLNHSGHTPMSNWDQSCVALVSVVSVTGLGIIIFGTDVALAGSKHLIVQLYFCRITFFTEVSQIILEFGSQWWGGIRDILPGVQRNDNSDVSLHNVLTGVVGITDDPGSYADTLAFVVNKNSAFIFTLGCWLSLCVAC